MRSSTARRLRVKVKPMDKLKQQLREDAAKIDVTISPELDDRIRASLEGVTPEKPRPQGARKPAVSLWWMSSLTGIAAALLVLVILDRNRPAPAPEVQPLAEVETLRPPLKIESAVLTAPLARELENLEADLRKAEQMVMADIGLEPR